MIANIERFILEKLRPIIDNKEYQEFPTSFIYPKTIQKNALLFLGINPSADISQVQLDSYELNQLGNGHPYFKRFEDISNYCQTPWTHLDLLYFRETNQNTINDILRKANGVKFIWEQLQITDKLIKDSKPKIIIVSNALARTFIGFDKNGEHNKWLDYEFVFDYEIGTYRWDNIPVFFSSMLTGQRALDNGSYERLKWQIRRTLLIRADYELKSIIEEKIKLKDQEQFELVAKLSDREKLVSEQILKLSFPNGTVDR